MEASLLPEDERTATALLDPLMFPVIEMCDRMASHLSPELGGVFLINCFVLLRDTIAPYPPAEALFQALTERIDASVKSVCESEARTILTRAQLRDCLESLREPGVVIASVPGLDSKSLAEKVKSLESSVVGEAGLVLGTSNKVQDSRTREKIRSFVVASLVEAYELICKIVNDPQNNYSQQLMQYTPAQFKMLL